MRRRNIRGRSPALRPTRKTGILRIPVPALCILLALALGARLSGQPRSRTEEIERARDAKAKQLQPDTPDKWEQRLIYIKDAKVLERLTLGVAGFRVRFGGLPTGSGFALGPEYYRQDFADGKVILRSGLSGSVQGAWRADAALNVPGFAGDRLFWKALAMHNRIPRLPYYGRGPDSEKSGRSNYLLESTSFDTDFGVRSGRLWRAGVSAGYLLVNTGPGRDRRFISAEQQFPPAQAPGIDTQTGFFRYGGFLAFDYRDADAGPRAGGYYSFRYDQYGDQNLERHSFGRGELDLMQYFPLFNKRRVIALRGRAITTVHRANQIVPFYLQPVAGGSDDLRGFRPYRFYGDHAILMNAEWRWEVFSGMDMAVFADAGKVTMARSDLNLKDLESSVGFGLRFNVRNATFLRVDVGFSHEGFQVWFKFNDIFQQRPFGTSGPPLIE